MLSLRTKHCRFPTFRTWLHVSFSLWNFNLLFPGFDYSLYTDDSQIWIASRSSLNLELMHPPYSVQNLCEIHMGLSSVQPICEETNSTSTWTKGLPSKLQIQFVCSPGTLTITRAWTPSPPSPDAVHHQTLLSFYLLSIFWTLYLTL